MQAANPELDMPQILGMMQMAFDSEEPPIPHTHRGGPRPSYETHPMAPGNLAAAAMLAHGQLGDEDDTADAGAEFGLENMASLRRLAFAHIIGNLCTTTWQAILSVG